MFVGVLWKTEENQNKTSQSLYRKATILTLPWAESSSCTLLNCRTRGMRSRCSVALPAPGCRPGLSEDLCSRSTSPTSHTPALWKICLLSPHPQSWAPGQCGLYLLQDLRQPTSFSGPSAEGHWTPRLTADISASLGLNDFLAMSSLHSPDCLQQGTAISIPGPWHQCHSDIASPFHCLM